MLTNPHRPSTSSALCLLVLCWAGGPACAAHDPDARIVELSRRIKTQPGAAHLYLRRAECYRQVRRFAAALRDLRQAERLRPDFDDVQLSCANVFLDQRLYTAGLAAVGRYLERHPRAGAALYLRARLQLGRGEERAAAADYARAVPMLERATAEHYLAWARLLAARSDRRGALRVLDAGLERLGFLIALHDFALDLEEASGLYPAALARVDRILRVVRRRETWLFRHAVLLERMGEVGRARDSYLKCEQTMARLPRRCREVPATARLARRVAAALAREVGAGRHSRRGH